MPRQLLIRAAKSNRITHNQMRHSCRYQIMLL